MQIKEERFKILIGEQKGRILSVCRHFAKDLDDQKDLYQEILVNVWKGLESFRGDAQPGTWIYRIAVNTALGFNRNEKKRMQVSVSLDSGSLNVVKGLAADSRELEKEKLLEKMENHINQLSVIDKIMVTLMLEDLSHREIADIVGITEPNVRVKIHRIKNFLGEKMKGDNHENE
jgi:RNA polymerase sigma-70 factor, ECF subfamily